MTEPTCGNCRFGFLRHSYPDQRLICRRFPPPVVVMGGIYENAVMGGIYENVGTAWPVMGKRDWCGEHRERADVDAIPEVTKA